MRAYLKSIDEHVWTSIEEGYTPLTTTSEDGRRTLKPKSTWTPTYYSLATWNSKGLNAIFCGVDDSQYRHIQKCESAKEAWEILQITHEGTTTVKRSKLQMLTSQFESLRMEENETFAEFEAKLTDITNKSYMLGEVYSSSKIVRKILRSLPERF
ncbi:hypothetical protein ACOSQ4_024432 [Xanthoceras sorbifolium]